MKTLLATSLTLTALVACGGSSSVEDASNETFENETTGSETGATAASAGPAAPACADEGAGHSTAAAAPLALGELSGCLTAEPDVFSLRAPRHAAGVLYELSVTGPQGLEVKVSDAESTELASGSVDASGSASLYLVLATDSTGFLEVKGNGTPATYQLSAAATPLTDDGEPNDTREEAQPLNLGRRHTALLQTAANDDDLVNDFYQVLVSNAGTLTVEVEPGTDEVAPMVELLSGAGERVEESSATNRGAAVTITARVRRGPYYVRVVASQAETSRAAGAGESPRYLSDPYSIVVDVR